jgi:hypothetical protein
MTCQDLKAAVVQWMGNEVGCESVDSAVPTTLGRERKVVRFILKLPLLKPNGDAIDLGVEQLNDRWRISDLGDTYAALFLSGVDFETVAGGEFRQIKANYRISEKDQELFVESPDAEPVEAIFEFAHAVQSMLALQLTVAPKEPKRDFPAIVAKFFSDQNVSFEIPSEYIDGKTGKWKLHFVLNHARQETFVRALSAHSKSDAKTLSELAVYEIRDIKEARQLPLSVAVIADDEGSRESHWQTDVLRLFQLNDIPLHAFLRDRAELKELASRHAR